MEDPISIPDLIVNFFTVSDFSGLLSRSAMLPLIVFSILFGFGVNLGPGPDSLIARFLTSLSEAMMKVVQLVTYYAPHRLLRLLRQPGGHLRLPDRYGLCPGSGGVLSPLLHLYFCGLPLFAWFGGGKGAVKEMFRHIAKPAITSLGTCSSVATIPTNMEEAEATGISKDVSEIVVPLGATMHMDGSCFSCILKITFLFGVFGRPFDSIGDMALMVIVAVLSSVGMSGVPGGGYIGEFIMCSVFFPDQLAIAYPIAITIGNLVDPPATMINSAGDYVVSFLVSRFVDGKDWFQKSWPAGTPDLPFRKEGPAAGQVLLSSLTAPVPGSGALPALPSRSVRMGGGETAQSGLPAALPAAGGPRRPCSRSPGPQAPGSQCPPGAMSAALTAFTAPMTFRLTQGTSTSPATGSHTRPIRFFSAIATAWPICSGPPPRRSTRAPAAMAAAVPTSAWRPPEAPEMDAR